MGTLKRQPCLLMSLGHNACYQERDFELVKNDSELITITVVTGRR